MHELLKKVVGFQPVIVHRNEPIHPRAAFDQVSQRAPVNVRVEQAPLPVPYSAYSGVGRDAAHAHPTIWRYQSLAIPEWLSVMGWPFAFAKAPSSLAVSMPRGVHNPIRERSNIDAPAQTSLGAMTAFGGGQYYSPNLAKITF